MKKLNVYENEELRGLMSDYLILIKKNDVESADFNEVLKDFADVLTNYNPYIARREFNIDVFIKKLNNEKKDDGKYSLGKTTKHDHAIYLDESSFCSKNNSLAKRLVTLGHEISHQMQAFNMNKLVVEGKLDCNSETALKLNRFYADYNACYLTENVVDNIFNTLGNKLGLMFERYVKLTDQEKSQVCKMIAFEQYVSLCSEKLAEQQGYAFAESILGAFANDFLISEELKPWIKEQLVILDQEKKKDPFLNEIKSFALNNFKKTILDMSKEELVSFVSDLFNQRASAFTYQEKDERMKFLKESGIFLDYVKSILIAESNKDLLEAATLLSLSKGSGDAAEMFLDVYKTKLNISQEEKVSLENSFIEVLQNCDLPGHVYEKMWDQSVLDKEKIDGLIGSLFTSNQYCKAMAIFINNSHDLSVKDAAFDGLYKKSEAVFCVKKYMKDFVVKAKSGEPVSSCEFEYLCAACDVLEELGFEDSLKTNDLLEMYDDVAFMSANEEKKYFESQGCLKLYEYRQTDKLSFTECEMIK